MPLADDVDLDDLAARTERFTGADLEDLVRRAGLFALRESLGATQVTMEHFEKALKETRASVTPEMEKEYERIQESLKQDAMSSQPGGIGFISPGMLTPRGGGRASIEADQATRAPARHQRAGEQERQRQRQAVERDAERGREDEGDAVDAGHHAGDLHSARAGSTASEAPLVKPGRNRPKPSEASAKPG
jgi:hypothetical protein